MIDSMSDSDEGRRRRRLIDAGIWLCSIAKAGNSLKLAEGGNDKLVSSMGGEMLMI
jgi:hypothetical protein